VWVCPPLRECSAGTCCGTLTCFEGTGFAHVALHLLLHGSFTPSQPTHACIVLAGVYKSGGSSAATPMDFTRCVESAKLRYNELAGLIEQALAAMEE